MRTKFIFTLLALAIRHCTSNVPQGCKWSSLGQDEKIVCYVQENSEHLVCNRNSFIHISQIGNVAQNCPNNNKCCQTTLSANAYNMWTCPNNMEVYRGVVRWALEECSQRRYCVLDSKPGSPLNTLRNATRGGNKQGTNMITEFECIREDTFISLCKEESATGRSVHVSLQALVKDDPVNYQCKCDLESPGNITVTLMDVRLGSKPGNQLIFQDRSGTVRSIYKGGHQFYFNEVVSPGEHTISQLRLSVTASQSPESIFLKVEASGASNVKVTCYDADENDVLGKHSSKIWMDTAHDHDSPSVSLGAILTNGSVPWPYIILIVACFLVFVFGVSVGLFIGKRKSRKKAVRVKHANNNDIPRRFEVGDIIVNPLYPVAEPPSGRSGGSCDNTSTASETLSRTYEDIDRNNSALSSNTSRIHEIS